MSVFTLNAETRQDILLERRLSLLSSFNGGGSSNGVAFFFNSGQKTLPDRITNRISGECCTGCLQFALVLKKDGGVFFIITTRARTALRKFELFQNHRVVYNIPTFSFKWNKEYFFCYSPFLVPQYVYSVAAPSMAQPTIKMHPVHALSEKEKFHCSLHQHWLSGKKGGLCFLKYSFSLFVFGNQFIWLSSI